MLANPDGTVITREQARNQLGFKVLCLHEFNLYNNAARLERELHLHFHNELALGQRLWRRPGRCGSRGWYSCRVLTSCCRGWCQRIHQGFGRPVPVLYSQGLFDVQHQDSRVHRQRHRHRSRASTARQQRSRARFGVRAKSPRLKLTYSYEL